jgi:hypothetical protein
MGSGYARSVTLSRREHQEKAMLVNQASLDCSPDRSAPRLGGRLRLTRRGVVYQAGDGSSQQRALQHVRVDRAAAQAARVGRRARVAQNLSEHSYSLVNKEFEGTVEIPRIDIRDDNLGYTTSSRRSAAAGRRYEAAPGRIACGAADQRTRWRSMGCRCSTRLTSRSVARERTPTTSPRAR